MAEVATIQVDKIQPNPYNPRKEFDKDALLELGQSIKELGLLQPPTVYPENGHYVILCGERRFAAVVELGWEEIPCNVTRAPADKAEALQMALVENLQREDLKTSEEALAILELTRNNLSIQQIADALGRSSDTVATRYYIALHPEVLKAFVDNGEKDLGLWAVVGELETSGTRKNAIKYAAGDHYSQERGKADIRAAKRLEKLSAAEIEPTMVTDWMQKYNNSKQKITSCSSCEGHNCKDCVILTYNVLSILGWKDSKLRDKRFCLRKDQTCFAYKSERQKTIEEKLELCKKANQIWESYGNFSNGWTTVNMAGPKCGGKDCKKCKSCYKVPEGFHYEHVPGKYTYRFNTPYLYCLAEDKACYKKTLADFKKLTKKTTTGPKGLSKQTDDQLKKNLCKLVAAGQGDYYEGRETVKVLEKRGYQVTIKYEVEIVKPEVPDEGAAA